MIGNGYLSAVSEWDVCVWFTESVLIVFFIYDYIKHEMLTLPWLRR